MYEKEVKLVWGLEELPRICGPIWLDICADFFFDYSVSKVWLEPDSAMAWFNSLNIVGISYTRSCRNGFLPPWLDDVAPEQFRRDNHELPKISKEAPYEMIASWSDALESTVSRNRKRDELEFREAKPWIEYLVDLHVNKCRKLLSHEILEMTEKAITSRELTAVARLFAALADWETARQISKRALDASPCPLAVGIYLRALAQTTGEIDEKELNEHREMVEETPSFCRSLAIIYLALKKLPECSRYVELSLREYPTDTTLKHLAHILP